MPKKKTLENLTPTEQILLKDSQNVLDVIKLPGWLVISKFIQDTITWPNPKDFPTKEEVILPYTEAFGSAELARKLFEFTGSRENIIKTLSEKVDSEDELPNWSING